MLLIKLFGRNFLSIKNENKYTSIIIKEVPRYIELNSILNIQSFIITNNNENNIKNVSVQVIKIIKKKLNIIRFKRRKKYMKKIGYKQYIGYFKILENHKQEIENKN